MLTMLLEISTFRETQNELIFNYKDVHTKSVDSQATVTCWSADSLPTFMVRTGKVLSANVGRSPGDDI